jgi:AcrR family transcriptional regulator
MLRAMETPLRIIRAHVDNRCHNRPVPTDKQREREERIISTALTMMADFGGDTITMRKLAVTLRMSPATIRHHFIDIESILAEILFRHLTDIYRAIGKIPREHPTWRVAARGAYIEATRTFWGSFTEPHQLLLRARHTLPEDLAKPIAEMRTLIGQALAGEDAETAFTLLDAPHLDAADIEAMLAVRLAKDAPQTAAPKPAAPAKPAPPPTTPPHKRHYKNWKLERRLKSAKKNAARASPAPHDPPP